MRDAPSIVLAIADRDANAVTQMVFGVSGPVDAVPSTIGSFVIHRARVGWELATRIRSQNWRQAAKFVARAGRARPRFRLVFRPLERYSRWPNALCLDRGTISREWCGLELPGFGT